MHALGIKGNTAEAVVRTVVLVRAAAQVLGLVVDMVVLIALVVGVHLLVLGLVLCLGHMDSVWNLQKEHVITDALR